MNYILKSIVIVKIIYISKILKYQRSIIGSTNSKKL